MRSDHIAIYSDIAIDKGNAVEPPRSYRARKKVEWSTWKAETESGFEEWLKGKHEEVEESYDSFHHILRQVQDRDRVGGLKVYH